MASSSSSSPEISTAPSAAPSQSVQYAHLSREEVLEELSSRFILNLPDEELASVERVCFQMEQAHWYYEDFIREQNPANFPSYSLKTFCEILFRTCPTLNHLSNDYDRVFEKFMQYKTRVPVCGAIMLNETWDKCVLVKGWKSSAGWGFPKGKINQEEPRPRCAVREVLEETGYDLDGQIVPEDVIELSIREQSISLYIVPGVPEDFPFETRTRKEISKIQWFKLSDLPTWRRNKTVPGKFYLISPFIGRLKAFIHDRKPRNLPKRVNQPHPSHLAMDAQASSEDDIGHLDGYVAVNGDHAQESSSQSSSADNGEPQTPSPQYSAPHVNYHTSNHLETHNEAAEINLDGVDPHFARLLNSLSLSASASDMNAANEPIAKERSTSTPSRSGSDINSQWSVNGPRRQPVQPHGPSTNRSSFVEDHPSRPPTAATTLPTQPTPLPLAEDAMLTSHDGAQARPPSSRAIVSDEHPKQSPRLSRARRASRASADISPYLSRPHDIQKEMKYISLLENVAKESDRRSRLASQTPSIPDTSRMCTVPSLSAPLVSVFARTDSPVIYSSGPVAGSVHPPIMPPSRTMPMIDSALHDDPFTVRPRTGGAFHPLPYLPARKASLDEEQLRFIPLALSERGQPWTQGYGVYPPPVGAAGLDPTHGIPRPATMAPLRVAPPQYPMYHGPPQLSPQAGPPLSPSATFAAASAMPSSIPVNPARAVNNAHLLSILNTPSSAPRTLATPGLMSVNGVEPR